MHQIVEYVLGLGLILMGVQSPEPLVPSLFGLLVLVNAAAVAGPLSAFRLIPRRVHRVADFVVAALMIVGGLLLGGRMESASQVAVIGIGVIVGFVAWRTNFDERPKRAPAPGGRSDSIGRSAGRMAATGVNLYRRRSRKP